MGSTLAWAMMCDRGTVRPENQDATLIAAGQLVTLPADDARAAAGASAALHPGLDSAAAPVVVAVADGMGGPPGGAQASQVIIRTLAGGLPDRPVPDPLGFMRGLLARCDQAVFSLAERERLTGMGSTFTMLLFQQGRAHLCHVGDSRCYRFRPAEGRLRQWSRDQNVAAELVAQGVLTPAEARNHRASHTLTQAVGLGKPLDPQLETAPLEGEEELFLLCSDGLLRVFGDDEILDIILGRLGEGTSGADPAAELLAAVRDLVGLANRRGSPDNISVILLRLTP